MSQEPSQPSAAADLTFEQAIEKLEAVVRRLEEGQIPLGEALAAYEEGVQLLRRCHEMLQRAERRIELLTGVDADGNPITSPLDDSALTLDEKAKNRSRRRTATESDPPKTVADDDDTGVDGSERLF